MNVETCYGRCGYVHSRHWHIRDKWGRTVALTLSERDAVAVKTSLEHAVNEAIRDHNERYSQLQALHAVNPAAAEAIADAFMGVLLPPDAERAGREGAGDADLVR